MKRLTRAIAFAPMVLLGGCAGEIDHFSSRIINVSESISRADADNVVRNAVRASLNEPLTFVAVSKVTNGRQSDLKIGLPTITFGPAQASTAKQWVFSGNVADNSESYSLELAQLRTDTFTKGMLTPIDPMQLENYSLQGFSRELLLYLFLDKITVDVTTRDSKTQRYVFANNPSLDDPKLCPSLAVLRETSIAEMQRVYDPVLAANAALADASQGLTLRACPFHEFQYMVGLAVNYGVSIAEGSKSPSVQNYKVDLKVEGTPPVAPAGTAGSSGDTKKHAAFGLCFNKDLMNPRFQSQLPNTLYCEVKKADTDMPSLDVPETIGGQKLGSFIPSISFRSPYAIIQYLGALARLTDARHPELMVSAAVAEGADRRLFPIFSNSDHCYLASDYGDYKYCVPVNAYDAKAAINVMTLLLQENTNRSDLPSSAVSVQF